MWICGMKTNGDNNNQFIIDTKMLPKILPLGLLKNR